MYLRCVFTLVSFDFIMNRKILSTVCTYEKNLLIVSYIDLVSEIITLTVDT